MSEKEGVSLGEAKGIRCTDKALRVRLKNGTELWIPMSQIHDDSEVYDEEHEGNLVVTQWWAEKEGLS